MDREKIKLFCEIWEHGKIASELLNTLSEHPDDASALETITPAFQPLWPYLSNEFSERIVYLFSGAEIEPKDLNDAGCELLVELSVAISRSLVKLLSDCQYVGSEGLEELFLLWDEMPHVDAAAYQWMFDLCKKASISAPLRSYLYTLRLLEEQPEILSGEKMPHPEYHYRPSKQRTFEKCPICGGSGTPYFSSFSYRMAHFAYPHLPVKLWMKCSSCGDLYTWKYPEELLSLPDPEGPVMPDPAQSLTAIEHTQGYCLAIWADILDSLAAYSSGKKLLEVGVGTGELLAVALELGYQPDAVEIVPAAAHKVADMLGIAVWRGDFLNYRPKTTYSVITMGDVIEHVTDPEMALRNAYQLLRDDGVLWLSTPNFESSFSRMLKFQDPMWKEPYHISYFNRRGLEALAEKCGFVLREYHVSRRYNGSMELIFTKRTAAQGDKAG